MPRIDITTTPTGEGWVCDVTVGNGGTTRHRVRVTRSDLARLAPGASDPEDLVRASFGFLLEREPQGGILPTFDLPEIGRYFPDYEREIKPRQAGRSEWTVAVLAEVVRRSRVSQAARIIRAARGCGTQVRDARPDGRTQ